MITVKFVEVQHHPLHPSHFLGQPHFQLPSFSQALLLAASQGLLPKSP
jgi:hypothetical protein